MEGIASFLESLIGGISLTAYSLTIGGLCWGLFILRPWRYPDAYPPIFLKRTVQLILIGAVGTAITQLIDLAIQIWLITATLEQSPFPAFANTPQFQIGSLRFVLAIILSIVIYGFLKPQPNLRRCWLLAVAFTLPVIISSAWLVHGAGRFEDREVLMFMTVCHQVGAAIWIGSVIQIINVWQLQQRQLIAKTFWPTLLKRFSKLGLSAVTLLLVTGITLSLKYIDSWNGLIGTGYGNLVSVKFILLALAIGLVWLNRSALEQYFVYQNNLALFRRVPYFIEAETFILITLLFTAASLASQPPAIDIPDLTAHWLEVLQTFEPRIPRTESPSHANLLAGEAGRIAIIDQTPSAAAAAWSDFNHNVSGIFITVMSVFAMLSYNRFCTWARFWPVGFILMGIFLFFRSDAEAWPMGPIGFWESTLNNAEILQHRIATLLVFMLGALEIYARTTGKNNPVLPYIFPLLTAFGAIMLLTHSHVGFQPKSAFLIQVGHTLMGLLSLIMTCGRWLELRLDNPGSQIAGFISILAFSQIGLILMFYHEPPY